MSTRLRAALAIAVVLIGAAFAFALFARGDNEGTGASKRVGLPIGSAGISSRTSITPRGQLFGDGVVARLDLLVDREVIDPGTIRIQTDFAPYRAVGKPVLRRADRERVTRLRYAVALDCLVDRCAPRSDRKEVTFKAARVFSRGRLVQRPEWPALTIGSRLQSPSTDPTENFNPRTREPSTGLDWRAEVRVAAATWRIDPTWATVALVALALVLLGVSFFLLSLAYPGLARRLWRRPRRLSPLERALAAVQHARAQGVERDHRVALDDLATELRAVGAPELAGTAYALAWDEPAPAAERTDGLSDQVRELIVGSTNGHP